MHSTFRRRKAVFQKQKRVLCSVLISLLCFSVLLCCLPQLWNTFHPPELVRPALERTLKTLKLDYVDLYIIELPMAFKVSADDSSFIKARQEIKLIIQLEGWSLNTYP